jgi:endonuclease-3 related protein
MPSFSASHGAILAALARHYGAPAPLGVAAGLDPFPALMTVLLGRTTDSRKAAAAWAALVDAGLSEPHALAGADRAEIADALKSSGITVPARALAPIQRLAQWFVARSLGPGRGAESLDSVATESLRSELAGINGVGPATADALLLLALSRPVYPLDRATYRILIRHGWLDSSADYAEARDVVERAWPDDPATLGRLSDWLARIGTEFCRVRAAKCDHCPLRSFLPAEGPVEPDGFTTEP